MSNKILLFLVLVPILSFAQREKIRGSKIVTITQPEIGHFESVEVSDNLEIFIIKGDKCGIEIEADDNLHSSVSATMSGKTLILMTNKDVSGFKKFSVRVTYMDDFKMVVAKDESNITARADVALPDFTFKAFGGAKIFANVKSKRFTLMANDKSKTELNVTADLATIELSKDAKLKALISSPDVRFDLFQKSSATIEGDALSAKIKMDESSDFTGKNFTTKNCEVIMDGSTKCAMIIAGKAIIDIGGKADLQIYGDQKMEIRRFADNASIQKKPFKL